MSTIEGNRELGATAGALIGGAAGRMLQIQKLNLI